MFSDDITKKIAAAAAQIKTEPPKNEVNTKSVEGVVVSIMTNEELKGNQHKIDANKNGKIDAHDFKLLRSKKKVEEGVKGAGVGGAVGAMAGGPVGAAIGGALGHVAGEVLSSAKNKAKAMGRIAVGPSMADSKLKREEVEQIDEVGDTSAGRKVISSYVSKALGDKSKDRSKGLRKATSRLYKDNFYGKKNEQVEMNNNSVEEGVKGAGVGAALGSVAGGPVGAAIGGALGHVAGEVLSSAKNKAKAMGRIAVGPSMADSKLKKEDVEQLDEIGDTAAGQKMLKKVDSRAFYKGGTKSGGKGNMADAGTKTLERTQARIKKTPSLLSRAAGAVKKVLTREELEQINELDAAAIAAYKASPASNKKSSVPHRAGPGPSKFKEKMASVSRTAEKGHDYFGHDAKRQQSGYRGPGQSVMQTAADKVKKGVGAIKKIFSREEVEAIFNDFTLDEIHMFMMSEEFEMLHVESQQQIDSYLEERTLNEGFPTVADAKKRMAAKDSSFEKKKISTGTVYSRKYKAEPEDSDDMPKKKAKTMKEMLEIYSKGGAESLMENLMIEEPTNDEYKKEVEVAQAKADGKIRNNKQIAKAATQGVKMEEVENIDELSKSTLKSYVKKATKDASDNRSDFNRFRNSPDPEDRNTATRALGKSHDRFKNVDKANARLSKEEVELEMYDADEINGVQIDNIEERSLTDAEMNKREEIVKSMKKGIQGFKDRYGDRAKEVMYATATKQAKKD